MAKIHLVKQGLGKAFFLFQRRELYGSVKLPKWSKNVLTGEYAQTYSQVGSNILANPFERSHKYIGMYS